MHTNTKLEPGQILVHTNKHEREIVFEVGTYDKYRKIVSCKMNMNSSYLTAGARPYFRVSQKTCRFATEEEINMFNQLKDKK